MRQTIEIPKEGWSAYLDALNRRAAGHAVRVEVEDLEIGSQEVARLLPLQEIAFEARGSARGSIDIRVGFDSGELLHRVAHPAHVFVEQNDEGELLCMEIEGEDGAKTLVWSEHLPELPAPAGAPPSPGP
jgi:hypothetical protein